MVGVAVFWNAGGLRDLVDLGEVGAADEADAAIHHHELAVVPVVRRMPSQGAQRIERIELDDARTRLMQCVEQRRRRVLRAVGVVDDVDGDAGSELGDQQVRQQLAACLDVFEDIVFQVDVIARPSHGVEHRGKRLFAVAQQPHQVAADQRAFRQGLLHGELALQDVRIRGLVGGGCGARRREIVIGIGNGSAGGKRRQTGQGKQPATAKSPVGHCARVDCHGGV